MLSFALCIHWYFIIDTISVAGTKNFAKLKNNRSYEKTYFSSEVTMVKPKLQWVRVYQGLVLLAN